MSSIKENSKVRFFGQHRIIHESQVELGFDMSSITGRKCGT